MRLNVNKFKKTFTILLCFFSQIIYNFFFILILAQGQGNNYTIKGKINSNLNEQELTNIPIVLLRFDPSITNSPPMSPIKRSQTNNKGEYIFDNIKAEDGIEYLIGALIQNNRISSKRIKLKNNLVEILNINFEGKQNFDLNSSSQELKFDLTKITYTNNLLIFNLLEKTIRITEVIMIQNSNSSTVSSKNNPLKKELPEKFQNFQIFEVDNEKLSASIEDNFIFLIYQVPPGKSSIYFEYDLPIKKMLSYQHPLLDESQELSILYDPRYLEITAKKQLINLKQHGRYTIASLNLSDIEITNIDLKINKKIENKELFYIIIAIFLVMLVTSLIIFRFRMKFF